MRRVPHSPELLRAGSNIGHWVIGLLIGIAGGLAGAQGLFGNSQALHLWWSGTVAVIGLAFAAFLMFHHGFRLLPAWLADLAEDPQQRQHLTMGVLLMAGGAFEFARARGWAGSMILGYGWPLALAIIGLMFVRHTQHGTHEAVAQAVRFHRTLGGTLIPTGLLAAASVIRPTSIVANLWPWILLIAALQLIAYREPEGAGEVPPEAHRGHGS